LRPPRATNTTDQTKKATFPESGQRSIKIKSAYFVFFVVFASVFYQIEPGRKEFALCYCIVAVAIAAYKTGNSAINTP